MVEADIVEKLQEEIQYEKRLPTWLTKPDFYSL
jgi:hypothetical protein